MKQPIFTSQEERNAYNAGYKHGYREGMSWCAVILRKHGRLRKQRKFLLTGGKKKLDDNMQTLRCELRQWRTDWRYLYRLSGR